ncbi:PilZ domain-containing protein [Glaciecola siphonariae]|uniref:PilZ domain-containing protein n=1 Tax=Glaciecola siphonariae TaxID=521012 RepID=A0ABV9LUA2_9ALTE
MNNLIEKLEQFNAFFLIAHPIKVNLKPASAADAEQSMAEFEQSMPYAFRISSHMSDIESKALRPFRSMGEKFDELVEYLQLQAQKMDLMMSYILQQQDEEAYRHTAVKFGGGGVVVQQSHAVEIGEYAIIKLFLENEAAAIYCIAQAIVCEQTQDNEALFEVSYAYVRIREEDQELLVRASLHLQTAQLRKNQNT